MHGDPHGEILERRLDASDGGAFNLLEFEMVPASRLRDGDLILYTAGDVVSTRGEVVESTASMDASDTRVESGWIVVRVETGQRRSISGPR